MPDKKSFLLYAEYIEQFNLLTDIERGQLIMMILYYVNDKPVDESIVSGGVRMAFSFIKNDIDRNAEKYKQKCEKNSINGKQGGRPPKKRTVFTKSEKSERFSQKAKKADNENDSDSENESVNDSESESDIILYSADAPSPSHTPPTVEQVKAVCQERGYIIDADTFVMYYQSQNWTKANGQPVTDWLSALSYWNSREKTGRGIKLNSSYDSKVMEEHSKIKYRGLK